MTDETRNPQVAAEEAAIEEQAAPEIPGADQPSAEAQQAAAEQPLPESGGAGAAPAATPTDAAPAAPVAPAEAAPVAPAAPAEAAPAAPAAPAEAAPADPAAAAPEAPVAAAPAVPEAPPAPDKAAEYLALAQRTQADFENFRKRAAREAAAAADRGMARLAKELLPALDHLELALRAAEEHGGGEFAKGIRQIQHEMVGALGRVGIQPYSPKGQPFDPSEHEAMASQPVEGTEPGTVAEVYQQGYRINGSVLRPARVVVAA